MKLLDSRTLNQELLTNISSSKCEVQRRKVETRGIHHPEFLASVKASGPLETHTAVF
jgi:hypothetical protein